MHRLRTIRSTWESATIIGIFGDRDSRRVLFEVTEPERHFYITVHLATLRDGALRNQRGAHGECESFSRSVPANLSPSLA
jgi:hypothetical protein